MKKVRNLILLCMLLICQQYITAQSYNLGKQKQSFAYETLYAYHAQIPQVVNNETVNTQPTETTADVEDIHSVEEKQKDIQPHCRIVYLNSVEEKQKDIDPHYIAYLNSAEGKQENINSHYIAYLKKVELFNYKYNAEIAESFKLEYIKHLIKTLSEKELKERSKGYSKELRKYRL